MTEETHKRIGKEIRICGECETMNETEKKAALDLFDCGAVKFGEFRLKLHDAMPDAPISPIYIDLRLIRSFPNVMTSVIAVYQEMMEDLSYDIIADVPTAATPIVAILSHILKRPMISPRKDEKKHGIKRAIDGVFHEGEVALVVDDLITHAESKLQAISVLEENHLIVRDVVVLIDREQGGVEELKKRGYVCHIGFRLGELLKTYLDSDKIDTSEFERTLAYLKENS
jgi:uridine monophosphate synthetase